MTGPPPYPGFGSAEPEGLPKVGDAFSPRFFLPAWRSLKKLRAIRNIS
jgi:hypothetical protein